MSVPGTHGIYLPLPPMGSRLDNHYRLVSTENLRAIEGMGPAL